jgi:dTDP-4-amino-4,6-dideoxygalactose transaminase
MAETVGAASCSVISTGRAGMTLLLRALRTFSDSSRDEVIIPSYTCYSVAASVVKAGLTPRLVDIDLKTLDFEYTRLEAADFRRVLAVVATNLYGLPNNLVRLKAIAHAHGVFVVDDAAQSLGARVSGRWCGTGGDVGLYSFDKGKNVSAIDGGAIVTDDPRIAEVVARSVSRLPRASSGETGLALVKLAAYTLFLRPGMYWIPNGIPMLGLGRTVYATDYPITRHPRALSALAVTMLRRLPEYTARRRTNAAMMLDALRGEARVHRIEPSPDSEPAYLRLPLLLETRTLRDRAVASLNLAGIGATASYPACIADIPELRGMLRVDTDITVGRAVADCLVTLPTHAYVTPADATHAVRVLLETVASSRRASVPLGDAVKVAAR